ncbi:MAG: phosphotransferase [Roseobacter sp.]|jgi:aminoglycoside/choline kinase family phosphotransferase|nr:phosphotransferase [Roseobacter sp.]
MERSMTRADTAHAFIAANGWGDAQVRPLAGDASNRRYDRLTAPDGRRAVLMDAPPDKGEDTKPFIAIAEWLTAQGLSAPRIYAKDTNAGFLLIEDLGDRLFAREMATAPELQEPLYRAAVDVLVRIHTATPPTLPRYESTVTVPLACLAFDWYQRGTTGTVDTVAKTRFSEAFAPVMAALDETLTVLIQRDFHAENLLWLPDRAGAARVGLLDFQDAMIGHPSYDLVSILQDARRDVPNTIQTTMKRQYATATGTPAESFDAAYAVFGLQRSLRILGVFARLCLRDNKAHYVDLLPRVWEQMESNLEHPATAHLRSLIAGTLPAPDAKALDELKRKSGSCAGL